MFRNTNPNHHRSFIGGRNGGRRFDGRRSFTKLLKDGDAVVRHAQDAVRFIEGMETYRDASQTMDMLAKLDDNRDHGPRRIKEVMSYIDSVAGVENLFIRFLSCVMTPETSRPLYVGLRNKILLQLFLVPMLLEALVNLGAAELLPFSSAKSLCHFLEAISSAFVDARMNQFVLDLANQLDGRDDVDARALCALVLVRPRQCEHIVDNSNAQGSTAVVWTTDFRQPGGRHDNDHLNFRNVCILPTADELRCEFRPWLPLATGANNFIDDPVTRLIGNNFRLLREDAIFTMKERIGEVHRPWSNARIIDLDVSVRTGTVSFIVQCDAKKTKKKKINWEFSRLLGYGSVVAFCNDDTPSMLGTITARNKELLDSPGGPKIGVSFGIEGEHFKEALNSFLHNSSNIDNNKSILDMKKTFILIEASSSFPTYEPVLKSLQRMTEFSFQEELCSEVNSRPETPLPFLPIRLAMPDDSVCSGHTLDLQNSSVQELVEKQR